MTLKSTENKKKIAVVLFNLGGPDGPQSVQPFLFNLFNDKAIIGAPQPFRWGIAKLISSRRAPIAQEIYHELGGGSPLLPNTQKQADALEEKLNELSEEKFEFKCFISMRYWHPFSYETVKKMREWGADEQILLPLYPQFSTTTSESSRNDWLKYTTDIPHKSICCYPTESGFIEAQADLIRQKLQELQNSGINQDVRLLFTAHGLPKKVIEKGDPYQYQVEITSEALVNSLQSDLNKFTHIDWVTCYQSRVGPLEWIQPYTEEEIKRAGSDKKHLVVIPIAFVSEHSETLVELDIEYKELAEENNILSYHRVSTVGTHPLMIKGLAETVFYVMGQKGSQKVFANEPNRICPKSCKRCIHAH